MTDEDGATSAPALALFGQLTSTIAELKQQNVQIIEIQRKQGEMLIRIDERQSEWATKRELAETTAHWQLALQPVAAKTEAAHARLDAYEARLSNAIRDVRVDFEARDRSMEELKREEIAPLEAAVLSLRLGWARAAGIAVGAGLAGGTAGGMLSKILGG